MPEEEKKKPEEGKSAPEVEKKETRTEEEIERDRRRAAEKMFPGSDPEIQAEFKAELEEEKRKKAEEESPPEEEVEEPEKEEPKEDPKPEDKKPQESRQVLTDDALDKAAERALKKYRESQEPEQEPEPPPAPVEPELDLSDEAREMLRVFEFMERNDPTKKGVADKLLKFWDKELKYREEWEKNNPGEEFDAAAEDHQAFYNKTQPKVGKNEIAKWQKELDRWDIKQEVIQELKPELKKTQVQQEMRDARPDIYRQAHKSVIEMIEQAHPELAKLMEKDGKKVLNAEVAKAMEEADPAAFEVLNEQAERLRHQLSELDLFTRWPEHHPVDESLTVELKSTGEKFRPHREIFDFVDRLEEDAKAAPIEETTDKNGRRFATHEEFRQRYEAITSSKGMSPKQKESAIKNLDSSYWTFSSEQIKDALKVEHVHKTKRVFGLIENATKKKAAKAPEKAGQEKSSETVDAKPPTRSPAPRSSSEKVTSSALKKNDAVERDKLIETRMGWA